jgi:tRNA-splicing ligase RtcB
MVASRNAKKSRAILDAAVYLTSRELAYLEADSEEGKNYLNDMMWCQKYAFLNREIMINRLLVLMKDLTGADHDSSKLINIHHNFVEKRLCRYYDLKTEAFIEKDLWITRKGATSARLDEYGIIPGSMGVGSYVIRGKGNPLSWESCSHGAGRTMSRSKAKQKITFEEFQADMRNILHDSTRKLIDEAPKAYKPLDKVMKDQEMLVEVVHRLLPLINVKGY